jgi:glyoxylase-like metal-dependent hydrolase (beta-lactamase superfamily II)
VRAVSVADLGGGVYRVTHALPFGLDHVHCYAVAGSGGWTLIDAGLGRGAEERWCAALDELGRPHVRCVLITHYHPDHVGGSAALVRLTGAEEVLQGTYDALLTRRAFGDPENLTALKQYLREQGMPPPAAEAASDEGTLLFPTPEPTRLLEEGDAVELGGEEFVVLHLPGHADGHIALFGERSGKLFGGDVLLQRITPNVGTWHDTQPDPLARYLATLGRIAELRPALVYAGHHGTIDDAAGRAREIQEHHRVRLDIHHEALRDGAVTPYEVSVRVWGNELGRHEKRFALVEAISHLVRLKRLGRAEELAAGRWRPL